MPFAALAGPVGLAATASGMSGGAVLGLGLATAAATGYMAAQNKKVQKSANNAANDAQIANQAAIQNVKDAQGNASAQAASTIAARRRTQSQTVYTSPLGVTEQASVAKKSLLGE